MAEKRTIRQKQGFEDLAVNALEGLAGADEVHALEELLRESEKERKRYLGFAAFECALEDALKGRCFHRCYCLSFGRVGVSTA